MWFTEFNGNKVAKITTRGAFTEYAVPTPNSAPDGIAAGPDGNMWFAEFSGNQVGKVGTGAGLPSSLVFSAEPGNAAAGHALSTQPVLTIKDVNGYTVTGDSAQVTLYITAGTGAAGAAMTCTANPVAAVGGVATFAGCAINLPGTGYTLTAIDTADGLIATSQRLDVSAATLPVRIFGPTAIDTAISVSQQEFTAPQSAGAVVVARSDFFSDALAGGPLAAAKNAPLLITPGAPLSSSLDPQVRAEIERVLPSGGTVYLLGGPLALSTGIDQTLAALGYQVVRVAGENLYSTAVAIADELGDPATVFETTGLNFPDALSAEPAAIHAHGAILLTNGTTQSPETAAYLAAHPPTVRYAIGGPLAAFGADPSAIPVYGQDLFDTSAAVAGTFFAHTSMYGIATGLDYSDALTGGVFMATGGRLGPVLLVATHTPLPAMVRGYLTTLSPGTPGFVFGGPLAVGHDVVVAIHAVVG
jgi:hypothetical protein